MGARRAQASGRTAAIAVSLLTHAGLLAFIVWRLTHAPEPASVSAMQVTLIPRLPPTPDHEPVTSASQKVAAAGLASRPRQRRPPVSAAPSPIAPAPTLPESAEPQARQALRGLLGCRAAKLAGLSEAERERCLSRLAQEAPQPGRAAARLNLDPEGRYAEEALPYLPLRPTRGCKPRLTGDESVMDKQGARAGFTCVKPF